MQAQIERAELIRYAHGLIGLMPINQARVRAAVDHIINYPTHTPGTDADRYYQRYLERWGQDQFEAAILGRLDIQERSLSEYFAIEDGVRRGLGLKAVSVERRLDFCILAATSAAIRLLGVQNENSAKPLVQIGIKPHVATLKFDPFQCDSVLRLEDARHIQRLFIEAGADEAVRVGIAPAVERYKNKKIAEFERDYPDVPEVTHQESEFKRMRMSEDDIYSFFLRRMLEAVNNGYLRVEEILWFFKDQGFTAPAEMTACLTSYAYLNKARTQLAEDAYENLFGEPEDTASQGSNEVIAMLTRANSFIRARIPFLVAFDRITLDYDDIVEAVLSRISAK